MATKKTTIAERIAKLDTQKKRLELKQEIQKKRDELKKLK
jgi:hypothetical protein